MAWHRDNELSRRLAEIPGIGPIGATLLVMKMPDPGAFRSGRDFAAWIGLTPKDHSTAGKTRLGVITRAGDEALRSVLVAGATAVIQQVAEGTRNPSPWLVELLKRKPPKLAAVALANKMARIAWKLMVSGERYDPARIEAQLAAREGRGAALCGGSAPRPSLASRTSRERGCHDRGEHEFGVRATHRLRAEAGACSRRSRWCDRSIPRRETLRGTQWQHSNTAALFGTRVAKPILAAVMCDRDNRPDI